MLDSRRLEVFRAVARTRSFSLAGDRVGLTQPGVSRQIAALEAETGQQLLERSARRVRLTEAGELLLTHAEAVLDRLALAESQLTRFSAGETGSLRIAAHPSAAVSLIPDAIAAFAGRRPEVELSLFEADGHESPRALQAGTIDLAVISVDTATETRREDDLTRHHLLDDEWLLVLPANHPLAHTKRLRLVELAGETMIESRSTAGPIRELYSHLATQPRIRFQCEEWLGRQGLVAAGVGLTVIPRLALTAIRPDLIARPLGLTIRPRRVYATHHDTARQNPLITAMVADLRRAAEELPRFTGASHSSV